MKLEEIFAEVGLYVADAHFDGVAVEIYNDGKQNRIRVLIYEYAGDENPEIMEFIVAQRQFSYDYFKISDTTQLFGSSKRLLVEHGITA